MKIEGRVEMGKKGSSPGTCIRIGRSVTILRCGLAHAGNSIMKGDARGIGMGLDTASEVVREAEGLMPREKSSFRLIKAGLMDLAKKLKPGKKISKKEAGEMLGKVRELGIKVDVLYSKGVKGCV